MTSFIQERDPMAYEMNGRRHMLPRASVTTPSITTKNAIRESLTAPCSPERATDILSKVFCTPTLTAIGQKTPALLRAHMDNMIMGHAHRAIAAERHGAHEMLGESPPDNYFSFPSFENWHEAKDDEPRDVFG